MDKIDKVVKAQLDEYAKHLLLAKAAGRTDNVVLVKAQVSAYRLGLETCLSKKLVETLFDGETCYGFRYSQLLD